MPKSVAERQAEFQARRRDAGLVRLEVFVHPDDRELIRELARKLNERRARKQPSTERPRRGP